MPYGLTGATQMCQRGLDKLKNDCRDCVNSYVDDFIVFSGDMESHISDLRCWPKIRLMVADLMLRGSKCFFGRDTVNHLECEYTSGRISTAEEKTQTLLYRLADTNHCERGPILFGPGQLYRQFLPKFSDIAAPLHDFTTDIGTLMWEHKHQETFETLNNALYLPHPRLPKPGEQVHPNY